MKTQNFLVFFFVINCLQISLAQNTFPSSGKVGIGTTNPSSQLHVKSRYSIVRMESSNRYSYLSIYNDRGYKGYLGTYSGINDIDVGTGYGNFSGKLNLVTNASPKMSILGNGNVGIGTTNPLQKLHIVGNRLRLSTPEINNRYLELRTDGAALDINANNGDLYLHANNGNTVIQGFGGRVGIGTGYIPSDYKLSVDGKVICEELTVQLSENWPDYVFQPEYKLISLEQVQQFIREKGHLPGIPSAGEIEEQGGLTVGEMQRLMMEKIEELTLYMIELKTESNRLREAIKGWEEMAETDER